ncbi:hypothetical protein AB0E27_31380 [Streptomyces sparsogenes]
MNVQVERVASVICELWRFFWKKHRKGNGVWWALAYTWDRWQWLRQERKQ